MENNNFYDLINLISLIIGVQNLKENRAQSEHNDIQAANQNQAEYLLSEIYRLFDEQNKILDKIYKALEKMNETEKNNENQ